MKPRLRCIGLLGFFIACGQAGAATLLSADFQTGEDGFVYCDDPFLGTSLPDYVSGSWVATDGYEGTGALQTTLGDLATTQTQGASGGWCHAMELAAPASGVSISFRYKLQISEKYAYDEYSRLLIAVDGKLFGRGKKNYVDHLGGDDYSSNTLSPTTDWQQVVIPIGALAAGNHRWQLGVYNNKSGAPKAQTTLLIDDVVVTSDNPVPAVSAPRILVDRLELDRFKANIRSVASFGDRAGSTSRFSNAQAWVADQLRSLGYTVEYHIHPFSNPSSPPSSNVYVTKVGRSQPDRMYIVSAHLDGTGGGGAADDDGSGVALLLEIARVLAGPDVETGISVRLIFWDYEENGLLGSRFYVQDRGGLQGIEDPPGSGLYPEPTWLGMLQHDMLLYDHGPDHNPPVKQSPFADLDVEWDKSAGKAAESRELALLWHHWNGEYASLYPSTAYDRSSSTDDQSFENKVASVSVRENRRDTNDWNNPNWHRPTDVYESYSNDDFALGFNAVQATLGTVATLVGARVRDDTIFRDAFENPSGSR